MPDWLRDLQDEVGATPTGDTNLPDAPTRSDADDTPDWLRDADTDAAPAPDRQVPDPFGATGWLQSLSADIGAVEESEPEPPPTTTTSRIRMPVGATDWLRSIGQDLDPEESQEAARPPTEMMSGVPDWLRDVSPSEIIETMAEVEPQSNTTPLQPVFDPMASNWLTEEPSTIADDRTPPTDWDAPPAQAETMAADSIPAWLRDVVPESFDAPMIQESPRDPGSLPDWLSVAEGDNPSAPLRDSDVPDWLRDVSNDAAPDEIAPAPAEPTGPMGEMSSPGGDDVPAWLREAEQVAPSAPIGGDDVPAWLHGAEQVPSSAPAATPSAADDVPAWLLGAEPTPSPAPPSTDDIPTWLREAEQAPPLTPAAPSTDDIPTWLRGAEPTSPPAPIAGDDVPAWLRGAEPTSPPAPIVGDDVPTWLHEAGSPTDNQTEAAPARKSPEDLPAWLAAASSETTTSPGSPSAGDMSLPSWLRGVADEAPPARTAPRNTKADELSTSARRRKSANEDAEGDDFLKGTELPDWLRSSEPELPSVSAEGQALDWLTRLGTPDEGEGENSSSAIREPVQVIAPVRRVYQRNAEQLEAIALLGRLVRTPYPIPVAAPVPAPLPRWQRIGLDRVLYVLLAIVLLIGTIIPQMSTPFQTTTPTSPGANALEQQLAGIGADNVVMVAYEWDAQRSAELRPLAEAVTTQLIKRKAKLILLSTDLQGTLLSFDLRGPLRAAGYNIDPDGNFLGGRDYVLLGYRPGGELALRRLAQNLRAELASDFEGHDATPGLLATNIDGSPRVRTIRDLSMIIVLADQPQDVQVWMEQIHTAAPSVPITFLMPQEAEPLVQPYLRLPNVYHLAGLQGALALSALGQDVDTAAIAHATGQQSLAVLTFVILLIGSRLGVAVARARRSRRGAA